MSKAFTDMAAGANERAAIEAEYSARRIDTLDAIFVGPDDVNWWRAFKAGPLKFWLSYRFAGDQGRKHLWARIQAEIVDILSSITKRTQNRASQLRKRLTDLETEIKAAELELNIQTHIAENIDQRFAKYMPKLSPSPPQEEKDDEGIPDWAKAQE